jgi:hypothetical protein
MSRTVLTAPPELDLAGVEATVARDGIAGLPGAFPPEWVTRLRADFDAADAEARALPGGTVGRGPHRYYFTLPPERLSGFADLVTHPWVTALSERVLGPDWQVVEIGFDVPLPGALDQPWHRDFRMPATTRADGRLTSLAFNVTTVTVTPEMGPLEVAPGTHRETGDDFEHGMFPPESTYGAYAARAVRKLPTLGDASVRTGLMIHRGTRNRSGVSRPVLILGTVAPGVDTAVHRLVLSRSYAAALPAAVRDRLYGVELVDEVTALTQQHDIEGLQMGG